MNEVDLPLVSGGGMSFSEMYEKTELAGKSVLTFLILPLMGLPPALLLTVF